MSLDDLLGLLFLLVFVVGPILKGLLKGSQEAPLLEAELPEPPSEVEAPPPADSRRPRVRPVAIPSSEPAPAPPEPEPKVERPRVRPVQLAPPPEPEPEPPPPPEPKPAGARPKLGLRFHRGAILEGVVWHEILSEPRARRRWKPKR